LRISHEENINTNQKQQDLFSQHEVNHSEAS